MGSSIVAYLKEKYNLLKPQPVAHVHIEEDVTGIALTAGNEVKLDLTSVVKHVLEEGGWVYDNVNSRFTWTKDFNYVPVFAGTASVEMTTGAGAVLEFKLKLNGNIDILVTPATFSTIDRIQQLAAVDLTENGNPYIEQGDYLEVWAESDANATFTLHSFQIALLGR